MTVGLLQPGGSWLETNRQGLEHNLRCFRSLSSPLGVVLKANAYGHGLAQVVEAVHPWVDVIFVIEASDGEWIRTWESKEGKAQRRIIVIGRAEPGHPQRLRSLGIEMALGDSDWSDHVQSLRSSNATSPASTASSASGATGAASPQTRSAKLRVHVQLDTGLGREGYLPQAIAEKYAFLKEATDVLEIKGVMSHFANTEDVTEQSYALHQLQQFQEGLAALKTLMGTNENWEQHFAASAAAMVLPESRMSLLRVGISLYGLWPSSETRVSSKLVLGEPLKILPCLTWKCRSQLVKSLPAGEFVGYGCTWKSASPTRIAVFPVGYYDGYPRAASGKAHVLIQGRRCPVIGRVMMNHILVDVGGVASDDAPLEATLMGAQGNEAITADHLASWAGTIPYEIVARLGGHLKRILV